MNTDKKLVFSGVQPTGNLHLGNYLGAIKNFVLLQKKMNCIFCVVDLHAITVFQEPKELKKNILETTAGFLASGLDEKKNVIFCQSSVSGHSELAWILSCTARLGWLNRMTQFKDKAGSDKEKASVGLYIYPNLMAADILLYRATHVPVGADQKQHLELTRDIAQKFNNDFNCNNFFPIPETLNTKKYI
jgi:tryptophanyl-tRNA synthetase